MTQCIIFDCDGTLVDSEYLGHAAIESMLNDIGIKHSAETMMAEHRGGKLADILSAIEINHDVDLGEHFVSAFRGRLDEFFKSQLKEIDGVTKMLSDLTRSGLPMCVASGGPMKKVALTLSLTNLNHYFGDNIFSSYEINSWKPDPTLFLHAAKAMNTKPEQCLVVEDSPIGIEAALVANMNVVFYNPLGFEVPKGVISIKKMAELPQNIYF